MKPSEDLFHLIQSLSRSEKRYFKLFSNRHSGKQGNNYLRLFDAIEEQEEYNEEQIRNKFRGEKFLRQLPVAKNYLYKTILRSLSNYHSQAVDAQLIEQLQFIQILFEKRLYKQCQKQIHKSKKTAEKHEKHTHLLNLLIWERRVMSNEHFLSTKIEEIDLLTHQEQDLLEQASKTSLIFNRFSKLFIHYLKAGAPRTREELQVYDDMLNDPLFSLEQSSLSFSAKGYLLLARSIYAKATHQAQIFYDSTQALKQMYDASPEQAEENEKAFITTIANLMIAQIELHKFEEFEQTLAQLRGMRARAEDNRIQIFLYSSNLELSFHYERGTFEEGYVLIPSIRRELRKLSEEGKLLPTMELTIYYNMAHLQFATERYSEAMQSLAAIQHSPYAKMLPELERFARIFMLILHYELNNRDVIDYSLKSTYRFLTKHNKLYKLEEKILTFLRRLPKITSNEALREEFASLLEDMRHLRQDPFEYPAFQYFAIDTWLESKLTGRSFSELSREQVLEPQLAPSRPPH